MFKVTLDTNCVLYYLDAAHESPVGLEAVTEIMKYGMEGDVHVAITTRVSADVEEDANEARKKSILSRLAAFPVVGTVLRFDVSKWDGGDMWAGDEMAAFEEELQKILFPNLNPEDKQYKNKINDIDHLVGHKIGKRDIFVTTDRGILKKAETLKSSQSITVMSPEDCVEFLNSRAKKEVVVEEFYERFKEFKNICLQSIEKEADEDLEQKYQELRPWMIKKIPTIKNGAVVFKRNQLSTPINSTQSMIDPAQVLSLQTFNDVLSGLCTPATLKDQVRVLGTSVNSYSDQSPLQIKRLAVQRLETIDTTLLGYLGSLDV